MPVPLPIAIVIALIALSVLVTVHEFGHFLAAKLMGVWPEEFGIGLPPRVWGKKIGETIWSVNALPLGGFVRLHGEVGTDVQKHPDRAFMNKSKPARAFIAVAGVAVNFLFAVFCFSLIFFITGIPKGVVVERIESDSAASLTEITTGDQIIALGGVELIDTSEFSPTIQKFKGQTTTVTVKKAGTSDTVDYQVSIPNEVPEDKGLFGVGYSPRETFYGNVITRPLVALKYGSELTWEYTVLIVGEFKKLFTQIGQGQVPKGLAGPVGVVGVTAEAVTQGLLSTLGLTGLISINLALVNLIPFPPLDGSRIMFLFIEAIVGKKRLPYWESRIHATGMYILLALMVLLTAREIPKVLSAGSLSGFVQSLIQ